MLDVTAFPDTPITLNTYRFEPVQEKGKCVENAELVADRSKCQCSMGKSLPG